MRDGGRGLQGGGMKEIQGGDLRDGGSMRDGGRGHEGWREGTS